MAIRQRKLSLPDKERIIQMNLLSGKICLITGASRGIGEATVKRFLEEGATVYANARKEGALSEQIRLAEKKYPGQMKALYFDVCDSVAAKDAIFRIKQESGRLDVLINNAGIMQDNVLGMISEQLMRDVFTVNVFAVVNMMQLVLKLMNRQKSGTIINISSIVGLNGAEGQVVYSASKGAVAAITKSAAKELAPKGIRVNAVAPGLINTELLQSIGDAKIEKNITNIRMGRLGTADDVADAILFLASDLSRYVTGEIVGVNGGAMV